MKKERRKGLRQDTTVDMDMTPMIDIVFQMVMFFIIITDFTQQDIALLELPWSTAGRTDDGEEPKRQIINITAPLPSDAELETPKFRKWNKKRLAQADQMLLNGKPMTPTKLRDRLKLYGPAYYPDLENNMPTVSRIPVLIRCDGTQAFDYVKLVLQICAQPDVAIYKIEIATAEKPGN